MISAKEIRTKIKSIQSTQKITRAMEMVAASKMKKAQDKMFSSRPYTQKLTDVIKHVAKGTREYKHPYTLTRVMKTVGIIIITSDRGLSGGLNINVLKLLMKSVVSYSSKNINYCFFAIGKKAINFLERYGYIVTVKKIGIGDNPNLQSVLGVIHSALEMYNKGDLDSIQVIYNEFVNTMLQKPVLKQLIPISREEINNSTVNDRWDYIYEPDAKELLNKLLLRYIESMYYHGIIENIASEQAARMVAMKSASDNASELINDFKLIYNKARQAAITRELSEIVSGADAV